MAKELAKEKRLTSEGAETKKQSFRKKTKKTVKKKKKKKEEWPGNGVVEFLLISSREVTAKKLVEQNAN